MKSFVFWFEFHYLKFVPKGLIDNMSSLVQVMAWRLTGDKPLPEPMMTQFTDAYIIYVALGGNLNKHLVKEFSRWF